MACPYFMPTEQFEGGTWPHVARLPLGAGWKGYCCAPGHEGAAPSEQTLQDHCNLGYATLCSQLPPDRSADAVRFSVVRDVSSKIELCFVTELGHRPAGSGRLEYDLVRGEWISPHSDSRTQKMAECYLQSYLRRRTQSKQAS